jgi:hypothetical protein
MILRSPAEFLRKPGSMQAQKAAAKLKKHKRLWDLAQQAMFEVGWGEGEKERRRGGVRAAIRSSHHGMFLTSSPLLVAQVDPDFAAKYTAIAVTNGFQGSPHIDKQNIGPFYGLALGSFPEGQGGIMVECSARVVAQVNTRNRLGKVDGRYPHWVAPYEEGDRLSLIFYQTEGDMLPIGPAVFSVPEV